MPSQGDRLKKYALPDKQMKGILLGDVELSAQFFLQVDKQSAWEPGRRRVSRLDQ